MVLFSVRSLFVASKRVLLKSECRAIHEQMELIKEENLLSFCRQLAPPLTEGKHKGEAGRIGVIGGSLEYTGAPYFSGISALKVGADLVHIFSKTDAAKVIKSYSPELIVHPLLDNAETVKNALEWLQRLHVIVIGPGLGRDPSTFQAVSVLIAECRKQQKPLVIDADGLFLITQQPQLIQDYPATVVLTPNAIEFTRLFGTANVSPKLLEKFGSKCTVVRKGQIDEIFDSSKKGVCTTAGSGRRCGGQGDLLSGSLAVFLCWALNQNAGQIDNELKTIAACYAACKLTRECNARGFKRCGRSMTCSNMIEEIGCVFNDLFELK